MSTAQTASLLQYLRHWAAGREGDPQSDRQLLERFSATREEAAFAALVQRHGPMVLSVCRRILARPQDVEDAFQAAFLVLLRRVDAPGWRDSVGGWLHRVATRIALRMRADAARRAAVPHHSEEGEFRDPLEQLTARELLAAFDEELARLPRKYREPVVLCHLSGQAQEAAARQLGVSLSTVRRRLEHGRKLLHGRLSRRGLALPAALTAGAAATVPAPLRAAVALALSGQASPRVLALAEGAMTAAALTPLKLMTAVLVLLGVLTGAGLSAHWLAAKTPENPPTASAADPPKDEPAARTDLHGDPLPPRALARLGTVRFRFRSFLGSVAYSPDGTILAATGYYGSVVLYGAASGRKLRELHAQASQFAALAFAPDGKTLASAGAKTIQIWDVKTGKELRRFKAEVSPDHTHHYITPLVFSPDGESLASVAPDHSVRIWDAKTGAERAKLQGHQYLVRCLAFAADGQTLFSASGDGTRGGSVRVWDLATGHERRKFSLHRERASAQAEPLCFLPDGKMFAFAAHEYLPPLKGAWALRKAYVVTFMDLEMGKNVRKFEPQEGRFKGAAVSRDGKLFATMQGIPTIAGNLGSDDRNRIRVYETATGKQLFDFPAYAEHISQHPCALAFAPDGTMLAAAANASALHVWDVVRGREHLEKADIHHDAVECVRFSPDGRTLASSSSDQSIILWDAATGRPRRRLLGHRGQVRSLTFSPDGKMLVSASDFGDQSVRLWDTATGKELHRYDIPSVPEGNGMYMGVRTWVAFGAGRKQLAAGGTDRRIRRWDAADGKQRADEIVRGLSPPPKAGPNAWRENVREVAFTPDGRVMALSINNGTIHVADVAAGERLYSFTRGSETTASLAFSPDGKTLACGSGTSLRLIEVASGKDLCKIDLTDYEGIRALAFAPDGRRIAVAAGHEIGWIYLFDVPTGQKLLRLQGIESDILTLAFSPDGTKLVSGQWDSTALIWDVAAARHPLPHKKLTAADLDRLWTQLRDADAIKAHAALWTLAAAPEKTVPFLKAHLHPVPRLAAERLRQLLADLDAEDFARREKASRELLERGTEVEPALRRILEGKPSLETRRRVEALLRQLPCQMTITPDGLRQVRAIEVLEQIGTMETREILMALAAGAPAAPATRDAAAALTRLRRER